MSIQKPTLKKVCLYLDEDHIKVLQRIKKDRGVSISVSVRKAIENYVEHHCKPGKDVEDA
ncbi:MAG: ribbon-helix-helix protein, CopG family [Candidatus Altiarchaeales archaeon]|nr:ribbon-helix-helix protein, CopG family [Candidatus Altiarchaeales archaeon]